MPHRTVGFTDSRQRFAAFWKSHARPTNDELKRGRIALYHSEKAQGTQFFAIVGAIQEHMIAKKEVRRERDEAYRKFREEEQRKRKQWFLLGADFRRRMKAWERCRNTSLKGCFHLVAGRLRRE